MEYPNFKTKSKNGDFCKLCSSYVKKNETLYKNGVDENYCEPCMKGEKKNRNNAYDILMQRGYLR